MKRKLTAVLFAIIVLTSCAGLTQVTVPQSTINFIGKDMETERFVEYTLIKTYVLGIGGMSERARNTNIIDELMKKANLQTNESLAYITVSRNVSQYLIVTEIKFTASGYVVRPKGETHYEYLNNGDSNASHPDTKAVEFSPVSAKQMKQLYKSLNRRINHAITGDDLMKIKEDVTKDLATGKLPYDYAQKLLNKIEKFANGR